MFFHFEIYTNILINFNLNHLGHFYTEASFLEDKASLLILQHPVLKATMFIKNTIKIVTWLIDCCCVTLILVVVNVIGFLLLPYF